jgi:hypothetical protein
MKKAFVYPDNSVTIDGRTANWTERDFRRHEVPLVRRASTNSDHDKGMKIIHGDLVIVAFPSIPATSGGKGKCQTRSTSTQPNAR